MKFFFWVPLGIALIGCAEGAEDDDRPTGAVTGSGGSGGFGAMGGSVSDGGNGATGATTPDTSSSSSSDASSSVSSSASSSASSSSSSGSSSAQSSSSSGGGVCGDGTLNAGETCDDGNTLACGTCSANCMMARAGEDCSGGVSCVANADCACDCVGGTCTFPYSHTITIDGTNDFAQNETFATTSVGYTAYIAWDASNVYVGLSGPDVASQSLTKFFQVYLGGANGTTSGVQYNTQAPTLPFSARYHVRWKADNQFTQALTWNGAAWVDAGVNFVGDVNQNGQFIEMRLPKADFGSPQTLQLHISMINEENAFEGTYSGAPSTSFIDGYDRDFTRYFSFNLGGCGDPKTFPIL
jgi:cysteine-rich repeat protein